MLFQETRVAGVLAIHIEPKSDERGFFARAWCSKEFEEAGLNPRLAQCSISYNPQIGTLRGMHYQAAPHAEAKLVRCTSGAIFDVAIDLRRESPTFRKWAGIVLSATDRNMIYIPEGCAHGFLTLEQKSEVFYQISEFYCADSALGVRWDDPAFAIEWPSLPRLISERDRTYRDFK